MSTGGSPGIRNRRGFTMIEIMAALIIIGLGITPLIIERGNSLQEAQRSLLLQEAMQRAETAINQIYLGGYLYFQEGTFQGDDDRFAYAADFSAEKISVSSFFQSEEEDEEGLPLPEDSDEEETIIIYHLTVTVTSREDADISVRLALDIPAGTAGLKGVEALLPEEDEE